LLVAPALAAGVQATMWGLLSSITAAASYGVATVYSRQHLRGLPSLVAPTAQLTMAALYLVPLSLLVERPYQAPLPSWPAIIALLLLTLLSTALPFVIFYRLVEKTSATNLSLVTYMVPVVATILGIVVLHEQPGLSNKGKKLNSNKPLHNLRRNTMKKVTIFIYGIISYLIGATAYFIGLGGFLGNFLGYYSIDSGPQTALLPALLINMSLIVLFGLPHSLMARHSFKQWWTKIIPPAAERSTYMLQSGLMALLLIWQWRPITQTVWLVENSVGSTLIWGLFWLGWLIAFISTLLINHFELTGLQQVYAYGRGQTPVSLSFRTPLLYKFVRHPMQLGVMLAFWAAPHMTAGHLIFAIGMTTYILIGLYFEERDLVRRFGDTYREYQHTTPKLIPLLQLNKAKSSLGTEIK